MSRIPQCGVAIILATILIPIVPTGARGDVTREQVEKAIRDGVHYLKGEQRPDGSWADADPRAHTGTTALVTLSLLTAGEPIDEPHVAAALEYLQQFNARDLDKTYCVALQTMVFAAADPVRYKLPIARNVQWLEEAQFRPGDRRPDWPGSWTYTLEKGTGGDNSNTQYALLGLNAATEVGVPVRPEVWALSRGYWEQSQRPDGSWGYQPPNNDVSTASMTCAGISSLVITGLKRYEGQEVLLPNGKVKNCGKVGENQNLSDAIDWLGRHFRVGENFGKGQTWKYYYLYGLERAGRLTGQRYFGNNDWYRLGAEYLVHAQDAVKGFWVGTDAAEQDPLVATSFALLFLAKGRAPVVINKLRHGPGQDWDNDHDDVRNLVGVVSRDWKHLLTWQVVDPDSAAVEDMLQAPIVFLNGHKAPEFSEQGVKNLREYVEQGGLIFAEACCSDPEFDRGFRALMKKVFPEPEYKLDPLPEEHAIWRSRHLLTPDVHPLWGIEHGCRTVVVYTPLDLSCGWNQAEVQPDHPQVIKSIRVGQNVVDYATGREMPADKLAVREATKFRSETAKRGALYIAKLQHAGEWNVAPLAIPNLSALLRDKLKLDVVINHRAIFPNDPNLYNYPLLYIHGRAAFELAPEDLQRLKRHLEPGGGTIFADAACGSPAFDTAFRRFIKELLPDNPLVPIPPDDEIYKLNGGFDLSRCQYTKAAGGGLDRPQLEGIKLNGHWAIIYSKYDLGCAMERPQGGLECKGYTHESALRIAANIVLYSTLP